MESTSYLYWYEQTFFFMFAAIIFVGAVLLCASCEDTTPTFFPGQYVLQHEDELEDFDF